MPADIRPTLGEVIKAHTACYIPAYPELLSKNTKFAHYVGITIAKDAVFGRGCVIFQNTTIGAQPPGIASKNVGYPRLGDNVWVLAGAVVAGGISIGDDAVIGANSVVLSDIPACAVAAGSPARVLRMRTPEEIERSRAVGNYNRDRTRH
jgi:serine O-acetyltransferase